MVGGQITLLTPRWATRCIRVIDDPTHLGILFGVLLSGAHGPIQILGTYWPCPPASTDADSMGLHSKFQQWLHRLQIGLAPMDYVRGLVRGRVLRQLGHTSADAPLPITVVLGDFNASWDGQCGPHKGLPSWASSTGLINPFAYVAHTSVASLAFLYSGLRPVGLIDHIFLSHSYPGLVSLSALDDGSIWSTVSDHRPVLLGLTSPGLQSRRLGRPLTRPTWPKTEVPSLPSLLSQYKAQLTDMPAPPVTDTASSSDYLLHVCVDSAAISATLSPTSKGKGKRWKNGWSPPMICLKANLEALWHIWGYLRGSGGRPKWRTQSDMDTQMESMLTRWGKVVQSFHPHDPGSFHKMFARGGYPPYWRTATLGKLDEVVLSSIQLAKQKLHGRQRTYLRTHINAHVYHRETSRLTGKIGRVIRSILHEEVRFYPIETLRVPPGRVIIDGSQINQAVTDHFKDWYSAPLTRDHAAAWWATRDRQAFLTAGRQASIPDSLLNTLWAGLLHVPKRPAVVTDLERLLSTPSTLAAFQSAIKNIRSSTHQGITYGMIKQ